MPRRGGHPVFNPVDFRSYLAGRRGVRPSDLAVPEDIIFTYDVGTFREAVAKTAATPVGWYIYHDRMYRGTRNGRQIGVVHAMVGAPAAAMNLEELIAYGGRRIFEVGLSGAIDAELVPGDIVVLNGAISDEGLSKHYFRSRSRFAASRGLLHEITASLRKHGLEHSLGEAWTTDAPYRETTAKVSSFRKKRARVVNMESAAVFAIAEYRGVEAASVQIVSDVVSEKGWNPAFHKDIVEKRRDEVLASVLQAITG